MTGTGEDNVVALPANETLRVCANYKGSVRKLLWLFVRKDGSFYTAFYAPRIQPSVSFPTEVLHDGACRFTWNTAEFVETALDHEHMSFHASGIINSRSGRSFSANLRLLTHQSWLCVYLPPHPSHWPVAKSRRDPELVIESLLDDECPLTLDLYYQPAGKLPIMRSDLGKGLFVVPIGYEGVDGHGRVLLHLVFRRQPRAQWAPYWTVAWPTIARTTKPFESEYWIEPDA